jgi:hypothetical protein
MFGRLQAYGWVDVHDDDQFARIYWLGESVEIGEVEAGVPTGEPEVGAGIMVRHGEIFPYFRA